MVCRFIVSLLVVVSWSGASFADEVPVPAAPPDTTPAPTPAPPPPAPAQAPAPPSPTPILKGPTVVTGRVTDVRGKPVVNMRVYVLPRRGQPYRTKTNRDGRYSVNVANPGTYGVVIAIGKAHTFRTVLANKGATNTLDIDIDLDVEGGEVITIEDHKRPEPTVKAKPKQDERMSLPYSEEAVERDAWARAWVLLDVDEHGTVSRLKLLKRPGFGLEKICLEEAFKLRFDPAKDTAGRPMKTYVLWTMEWPSWGWLIQGNGTAVRRPRESDDLHVMSQNIAHGVTLETYIPPDPGSLEIVGKTLVEGGPAFSPLASATAFPHALSRVPCLGSGPLNLDLANRAYRDCSTPDMAKAVSLPWITRATVATAVAEMAAPNLALVEEQPRGARWPGYVAAGATGTLAVATLISFLQYNKYSTRVLEYGWKHLPDTSVVQRDIDTRNRWLKATLTSGAMTFLVGGATLFLWNRGLPNFSVQPSLSGYGGTASYGRSW